MKNDKSDSLLRPTAIKKIAKSTLVHSFAEKSHTLYRRATQKPISQSSSIIRKVGRSMDIARSKSVSHFSTRGSVTTPVQPVLKPSSSRKNIDIEPIRKSVQKTLPANPGIHKPSQAIKEEAIANALNELPKNTTEPRNFFKRYSKFINVFSIGIILTAIIVYLMYINLPIISVSLANSQTGVNATYPKYHPDGYSPSHWWWPVSNSDKEVSINFKANTGNSKFVIKQSKSSWDSTAVKTWVDKDSSGAFNESKDRGLTIYSYGGNAAWVNGGILYSITGDAPLSGDQIRRIATSL